MHFSDYLFFTQRLSCQDYVDLMIRQNPVAHDTYDPNQPDRKCDFNIGTDTVTNQDAIHRVPFGDVLCKQERVFDSLKQSEPSATLDTLLTEWRRWHVNNLEPLCNYSLTTKVGKEMYHHQEEKKLVARYVAKNYIGSGDFVCIPEGSSATYVGLAIGLLWEGVTIIASNEPLLREYRENPEFAPKFREVYSIGGHVDDLIAHGGVSGPKCHEQYDHAISKDPGATVVIMPVTGLLPETGPYGLDDSTRNLKLKLIESSLDDNVRSLIFVADYSKHLSSKKKDYGRPVFAKKGRWEELLKKHEDRILFVTAPPPGMRSRMQRGELGQPLMRHINPAYVQELNEEEKDYDKVVQQLARLTRVGTTQHCKLFEVF